MSSLKKLNLHYTRGITRKRETSDGTAAERLDNTAPKKHRSGNDTVPDLIGPGIEPVFVFAQHNVLQQLPPNCLGCRQFLKQKCLSLKIRLVNWLNAPLSVREVLSSIPEPVKLKLPPDRFDQPGNRTPDLPPDIDVFNHKVHWPDEEVEMHLCILHLNFMKEVNAVLNCFGKSKYLCDVFQLYFLKMQPLHL